MKAYKIINQLKFITITSIICLFGVKAHAAVITVNTADPKGGKKVCGLIDAIHSANIDKRYGGCRAGKKADTIVIDPSIKRIVFKDISPRANCFGLGEERALPSIRSDIVLEGNGVEFIRDEDAPPFGFLCVRRDKTFTVKNVIFKRGVSLTSGGALAGESNSAMKLNEIRFINNVAKHSGGAIGTNGSLYMTQTEYRNNKAQTGGAIAYIPTVETKKAQLSIKNTTFSFNRASQKGGALYMLVDHDRKNQTLENNIFINNSAEIEGGAILARVDFYDQGKSIYSIKHNSFINNVNDNIAIRMSDTLNSCENGLCGFTLNIDNSIISKASNGENCSIHSMPGADLTIMGDNNVMTDVSCALRGMNNTTTARSSQLELQPLYDNGGRTPTVALGENSIAIEYVPAKDCLEYDQRGMPRPSYKNKKNCDAGNFETINSAKYLKQIIADCERCMQEGNLTGALPVQLLYHLAPNSKLYTKLVKNSEMSYARMWRAKFQKLDQYIDSGQNTMACRMITSMQLDADGVTLPVGEQDIVKGPCLRDKNILASPIMDQLDILKASLQCS